MVADFAATVEGNGVCDAGRLKPHRSLTVSSVMCSAASIRQH